MRSSASLLYGSSSNATWKRAARPSVDLGWISGVTAAIFGTPCSACCAAVTSPSWIGPSRRSTITVEGPSAPAGNAASSCSKPLVPSVSVRKAPATVACASYWVSPIAPTANSAQTATIVNTGRRVTARPSRAQRELPSSGASSGTKLGS